MMSVRPVGAVRPHASLGKRFLASVLDSAAVMVIAGGLLIPAAGVLARNTANLQALPVWALGLVLGGNVLLLALAVFQWWYQGTRGFTIGKLLMKIRTVDAVSGSPAGMGRILLREFILGIGSLLVALSTLFDGQGRNRGWHDLAANTVVIDCAAAANKYSAPRQAPPAPAYPGQSQPQAQAQPQPQSPVPAPQHTPQQAGPAGAHQWQQNSPVPAAQVGPEPAPQRPPSAPGPVAGSGPARTHALPAYLVNENNAAPAGRPPAPPTAPVPSGRPAPSAPAPQGWPAPPAPSAPSAQQGSVIQTAPGFEERRSAVELPDELEMTRLTVDRAAAPVESSMTGIPPSATLNFSDGKRITLTETVLIGRNPRASSNEVIGELIRVSDPGRSVSKTHVLIGVDDEGVWVSDRASTNGTIVTLADGQQILCSSHQVVRLTDGAVVSFGDYSIDFEYRNN